MTNKQALTIFGYSLAIAITTASCGGGGGGGGGDPRGVFIDSPVSGLTAVSGDRVSTTDANGGFTYLRGAQADFRLGLDGTFIGIASAQPIMTPLHLANASSVNDEHAINIARFLQTLDSDANPDNGISIDASVRTAAMGVGVNFDQSVDDFSINEQSKLDTLTASLPGGSRTLVSGDDARTHMGRSLSIVVTGRYDGSYGGDSNGNFSVFVDRDGSLYGWATDAFDGHLELTGSASVIDGLVAGNVSSGSTFNGSIDGSGNLTGTWTLPPNESGTFSGSRSVSVSSSIDHDLIAMFAGSWVGTTVSNQGNSSFSAALDDEGNISMPAPNQRVAGAITSTSTSTSSASFSGLRDDGTEFSGTLTLPDQLNAQFNNSETGESGTYSATK